MRGIPPAQREADARAMRERLCQQACWREARSVLLFVPIAEEPDIRPLFAVAREAGKALCLPRYETLARVYEVCQVSEPERELTPGRFGVLEPVAGCAIFPRNRLDFALVPGLCFDECGHRLGRGKGYYDRLLGPVRGVKCGVAFEEQLVSAIPLESHDLKLDCILTPRRWIFAGRASVA